MSEAEEIDHITACDGCGRAGKLVSQEYTWMEDDIPFIFRGYLCPWHLGAVNRHFRKQGTPFRLKYIDRLPDDVVYAQWVEKFQNQPKENNP